MRWLLFLAAALGFCAGDDAIARHAAAASAALRAGEYAAAEKHNRAIVRLNPALAEAQNNLGLSCFLQRKYEEAIQAFEAGLKLKPELANAWLFLGIAQFNLNRTRLATAALERYTSLRPDDFQGHYYLGLSLLAQERYREAEQSLLMARQIRPSDVDTLYHLAQSYLGQARQRAAGREALWRSYEEAVKAIAAIDPASFRIGQLRAGYYEATGEKAKAIEELEKLLSSAPRARGLHYTLGCLYMESRLYEPARSQFEAELQLDAAYPRTHLQLGHVYLAMQKPAEAVPHLERALQVDPESAGAIWVDLGRAYGMLGQPGKAVQAYERAIQAGERKSTVYYQLAMAYRKAGRMQEFQQALRNSERLRAEEKQHVGAPQ